MALQDSHTTIPVRIVAIDDNSSFLGFLVEALKQSDVEVATFTDPEQGLASILHQQTDIVLLDLVMPGCNGLELLERIVAADPTINVFLLTGEYSTDSAVNAIRLGAADYLNKPISIDELRQRVGRFVTAARERHKSAQLRDEMKEAFQLEGIIGWSPLMLQVFDKIRRIAPHFRSALIRGATGTGKELVARSLHRLSPFATGPFVVCNCAAMVESLFESELFGHVRGAFTGAIQDKKGYFELAHKGTLFLDEIGDASLAIQAKLLRVLQDHSVQRVGSPELHAIDVRVVTATNRDLRKMVAEKQFREDLYYRIAPVEIMLPPLNERREDLPLLERYFLERFAAQYRKPLRGVSRKAQILLSRHTWPGNVRELESVFAHACMMTQGDVIDVADLPAALQTERPASLPQGADICSLEEAQRRHILGVLRSVNNNKVRAAEILEISRTTLYRMLMDFGQPQDEEPDSPAATEVSQL